jgi:hypothetical protein
MLQQTADRGLTVGRACRMGQTGHSANQNRGLSHYLCHIRERHADRTTITVDNILHLLKSGDYGAPSELSIHSHLQA